VVCAESNSYRPKITNVNRGNLADLWSMQRSRTTMVILPKNQGSSRLSVTRHVQRPRRRYFKSNVDDRSFFTAAIEALCASTS
jgi:hypothetical protein